MYRYVQGMYEGVQRYAWRCQKGGYVEVHEEVPWRVWEGVRRYMEGCADV